MKAEAGDIRSAQKKADEAIRGYREMMVTALLKGPIKNAEVQLLGGYSNKWSNVWKDSAPKQLTFRWRTEYANVGPAEWQVTTDPAKRNIIASGNAGRPPAKGKVSVFKIDFADKKIAGNVEQRPMTYYVRVVTYKAGRQAGASPKKLKKQLGIPSPPVRVTLIGPGESTQFTLTGLHPELYNQMRISIDLETLKIKGTGYDEDPFLLIAVVYADGTTIVPFLDWTTIDPNTKLPQEIHFPSSEVRIDSPTKTHENVPGGDPGDILHGAFRKGDQANRDNTGDGMGVELETDEEAAGEYTGGYPRDRL